MITDDDVVQALLLAGATAPVSGRLDPDVARARAHRRQKVAYGMTAAAAVLALAVAVPAARTLTRTHPEPVSTPTVRALPVIPDGAVGSGRLLVTVTTVFPDDVAGRSRLAYLDSSGTHPIPTPSDLEVSGAVWATHARVVFTAGPRYATHIYVVNTDGTGLRQLTSGPGYEDHPGVSPTSGTVVYTARSSEGASLGLHAMPIDGGTPTRLTPPAASSSSGAGDISPTYSADGSRIAFVRVFDPGTATGAVMIMNADGSQARQLTVDAVAVDHPRWSPDGRHLLFSYGRLYSTTSTPVWIVDVAGGPPRPVLRSNVGGDVWDATWSPDGTRIAFVFYPSGTRHNELRTARADGSGVVTAWTGTDGLGVQVPDWTR